MSDNRVVERRAVDGVVATWRVRGPHPERRRRQRATTGVVCEVVDIALPGACVRAPVDSAVTVGSIVLLDILGMCGRAVVRWIGDPDQTGFAPHGIEFVEPSLLLQALQ